MSADLRDRAAAPATGTPETLKGFRVGITAARKADEQAALFTRRGAEVVQAPALSLEPHQVDADQLRAATDRVLASPVDIFVATTGIGMKAWMEAAEEWGLRAALLDRLAGAEILARGPKSVGVLRRLGLRELWSPESECFEDVLAHLRGRDLTGIRIVVQEHGQSLSMTAHALRRQGAEVESVAIYRTEPAEDPAPLLGLVDQVARGEVDAVTFTAAPAVASLMEAATSMGLRDEVVIAFQSDVVACCVGPVAAAAFELWGVPTIYPERSRLVAMAKLLETELPLRRRGLSIDLVGGRVLLMLDDAVLIDGVEAKLSPAPMAVLQALVANPGQVASRQVLLNLLPSAGTGSEHAVEMAVARLRAALGTRTVQTVVKRGYRLAVAP